ncbi:hypothetical protein [Micromonospora marina]|uniref:hypothetical protein n=1 Tax=Micromonospora marina TaxID=307120 RepID=UPI003D744813
MLVEAPLPTWASGRQVVAVGGQTPREVDDIGFVTDLGGWGMVQAKKSLRLEPGASSALAEALEQLIAVDDLGVPDCPPSDQIRPLQPGLDLVLVLTDQRAPSTINDVLAPVTGRLRSLPAEWPIGDVPRNEDEHRAFDRLKSHLDRLWKARHVEDLGEADLRRLGHVLSVRALNFADGGNDLYAVQNLLDRVASHPDDIPAIWVVLGQEAQRLADERTFLDRATLVDRLESEGIVLRPLSRLRADIVQLRQITEANIALMGTRLAIAAPEGPVELDRKASAVIAATDGNVALTGEPGVGKSVVLHGLAVASRHRDIDVVMLRSTNLRPSSGQVREELKLRHDLEEVLRGWPGRAPGLLLIDGLDQTRDTDPSAWLPDLAQALARTRWRVVATIRSFDLKHGRAWQRMFPGEPIDQQWADPGLAHVRHAIVADLTAEELRPLRAASPQLSELIDTADRRLRGLLTNPFNLDMAAHLLRSGVMPSLTSINSRADLLHSYWQHRVDKLEHRRTLRAVVGAMLAEGRQVVNPVELPLEASSAGLTALRHEGVLRDLPTSAGHPSALVEFSHPVLFDYAVAMLALGDSSRPESLADRLDDDPNLAIKVRPSMEYRLATVWRDDPARKSFWHLSLRLVTRHAGHLLAAAVAARVAAYDSRTADDIKVLADACAGIIADDHDRWDATDAQGLAFLLAAAIDRAPSAEETAVAFAAFIDRLAERAHEDDDIDLALLASQLPARGLSGPRAEATPQLTAHLVRAAVTCMALALADLTDPRRAQLAEVAVRPLAQATIADPVATGPSVMKLCTPDTFQALGSQHMWALVDRIPDIARKDPDLAIAIGVAAFEYEETRDEQTNLLQSAILRMTSNRRDELNGVRYAVGEKFKALADIDAMAATTLLLRSLNASTGRDRWPERARFAVPPHPLHSDTLRFSAGHGVLLTMTNTLIERVRELASESAPSVDSPAPQPLTDITYRVVTLLRHDEVWQRLLLRAATDASSGLAKAFASALLVPNLFAHPSTWITAAQVARRLSPLLSPEVHARLEAAIWGMVDAGRIPGEADPRREERLRLRRDTILRSLSPEHLIDPRTRQRLVEIAGDDDGLALPDIDEAQFDGVGGMVWEADPPDPDSPEAIQLQISAIDQQLRSGDEGEQARARQSLVDLWERLAAIPPVVDPAAADSFNVTLDDVRLQAAERLAHDPAAAPDTQLGRDVYATLCAYLPSLDPTATDESNEESWSTAPAPSWGSSTSNNAIEGIAALTMREVWRTAHGDDFARLLNPFLDSADPVRRFLASRALSGLYPDPDELFHQLQIRLLAEVDGHIAAYLLGRLSRFRQSRASEIDDVMRQLATHPEWACATVDPAADQRTGRDERWTMAANVLTALAAVDATPYATSVVKAWLDRPLVHPDRAVSTTAYLRDMLNPAAHSLRPAQERTFQLLHLTVSRLREAWIDPGQPGQPTENHQKRLNSTVKVAESICQQMYYASGAHDASQTEESARPRGDLRRFSSLALPLLEQLSAIDHPAVTHRIVQTTDHLRLAQPRRALLVAARTITGDTAYAREQLALTAVHDLVRHYLAEQRDLVLNDPECLTAIRKTLEAYVRLGWDKAIELTEELDELLD